MLLVEKRFSPRPTSLMLEKKAKTFFHSILGYYSNPLKSDQSTRAHEI